MLLLLVFLKFSGYCFVVKAISGGGNSFQFVFSEVFRLLFDFQGYSGSGKLSPIFVQFPGYYLIFKVISGGGNSRQFQFCVFLSFQATT